MKVGGLLGRSRPNSYVRTDRRLAFAREATLASSTWIETTYNLHLLVAACFIRHTALHNLQLNVNIDSCTSVNIDNVTHHLVGHRLLLVRPEQPLQVLHSVLEKKEHNYHNLTALDYCMS